MLVEGMTEGERERERAYLIPLPLLAGLLLLHHDDLQSMPSCVVLWVGQTRWAERSRERWLASWRGGAQDGWP